LFGVEPLGAYGGTWRKGKTPCEILFYFFHCPSGLENKKRKRAALQNKYHGFVGHNDTIRRRGSWLIMRLNSTYTVHWSFVLFAPPSTAEAAITEVLTAL
jgi:hypothetical protein